MSKQNIRQMGKRTSSAFKQTENALQASQAAFAALKNNISSETLFELSHQLKEAEFWLRDLGARIEASHQFSLERIENLKAFIESE